MSNKGSFYGISKLSSEKIVEEYGKRYGLSYTILRYGSVYSEMNFDNNYIYQLVKKAVKEQSINHNGDGEELREYVHAQDAAKLSVDVIESEQFENEHVILTGLEKMKRLDLFKMIKEMLNDEVEITLEHSEYKGHYKMTPYSFEPTRSRKLVANPHIDMGQGLLDCIKAVYKSDE
jgi:UDP-glucose 4-epimerase